VPHDLAQSLELRAGRRGDPGAAGGAAQHGAEAQVGIRPIWAGGLALLSAVSLACAPTHEKLWRELDQLELPEGWT